MRICFLKSFHSSMSFLLLSHPSRLLYSPPYFLLASYFLPSFASSTLSFSLASSPLLVQPWVLNILTQHWTDVQRKCWINISRYLGTLFPSLFIPSSPLLYLRLISSHLGCSSCHLLSSNCLMFDACRFLPSQLELGFIPTNATSLLDFYRRMRHEQRAGLGAGFFPGDTLSFHVCCTFGKLSTTWAWAAWLRRWMWQVW